MNNTVCRQLARFLADLSGGEGESEGGQQEDVKKEGRRREEEQKE